MHGTRDHAAGGGTVMSRRSFLQIAAAGITAAGRPHTLDTLL
jgi:hypothetical protein